MIEVIGEEGTAEYEAAAKLRDAFADMWPGCDTSPKAQDYVRIAANVKISGYKVSDIDVVVFGRFGRSRKFLPTRQVNDTSGKVVSKKPVHVTNILVAVEVKDHSESFVRIVGDRIDVKYSRGSSSGWKSATDQNVDQVHALKYYMSDFGVDAYVHRCVFMRGLADVPCAGAVAAGVDGPSFLTSLASISRIRKSTAGYFLSSAEERGAGYIGDAPIFRRIVPTALDRAKMDLIVTRQPELDELQADLGETMVSLRGRGGTGKTIMLLQAAWRAFELRDFRTLVLTYNHALAADIRRMLGLLNVPTDADGGGIKVETVMSFMYRWFRELGVMSETSDFSGEQYRALCAAARDLIAGGAISAKDIRQIIDDNPDQYDYDCVVVDEAQDWPQMEADLLKALYGPNKIAMADGIDQLVRGERTNWSKGVPSEHRKVIPLERCLRMKRNLADFANKLGEASGIKWNVEPNDGAGGGRVLILTRPYLEVDGLHKPLVTAAKEAGNAELDFLMCVPSSAVQIEGERKVSDLSRDLAAAGFETWDGVDDLARKDFPRSSEQFRIVQYASCRGLEGWTVLLDGLDEYWEECRHWRHTQGLSNAEKRAYEDLDTAAENEAWRRVLIALTRPIDTVVIVLGDVSSSFSRQVLETARSCEYVEVLK